MSTAVQTPSSVPSLSHGEPLAAAPAGLLTLPAALKRAAELSPSKGVRHLRNDGTEHFQSYPELLAETSRVLGGLRRAGLKAGDKVIFQLQINEDFVPAFWACLAGGMVPVPISIPPGYDETNNTLAKLQNAWTMLERPVVLAGSALAPGLEGFARRQGLEGFRVEVIDALRHAAPDPAWHESLPEDLVLLLLTSGSTGMPKGVQLSHRNILSRCIATAQMNGFGTHDVSINWMPLDHVGGVVMFHVRDVFLACDQIHTPTELVLQNPLIWLDWVDKYRVTNSWAPNFAFGLINDQAPAIADGSWDLSSLRILMNAGEAIVSKTARRFLTILGAHGLPATSMRPAWGMSETSSAVTYSDRCTLAETADSDPFVVVGKPIPGFSMRIVDRQGQVLPEGKIGSLQVKGMTVTCGYYRNPKLNAEVFTPDGWFVTGDLGVIKEGSLTITGREKDIIIVNGINFHSHEIESVVEEVPGVEVSFTAACPVRPPGENTDRIAIFFSPTPNARDHLPALVKAIRAAVVTKEGVNPDYVLPVARTSIPKTAIGKIQRSQLKQEFERGTYAELVRTYSSQATESSAPPDWFYRPVWRPAPLAAGSLPASASFLLFSDRGGRSAALARELSAAGHACTVVNAGADFERTSPAAFSVSPANLEHYQRLLQALGTVPDYIVHAWTCDATPEPTSLSALEAAQAPGAHSLLALTKALGDAQVGERTVRLLVASQHSRAVEAGEPIHYATAPMLGVVRTIPQEYTWLECRHVDLDTSDGAAPAAPLLAELQGWDRATESAWRAGTRSTRFIECCPASGQVGELPFRTGGLYVVSGGIGGIGLRIAGHLLQHFDARLLIVGRTPLPPRADWKAIVAAGGAAAERIRSVETLEVQGGEFEYCSADVADRDAMQAAVARAEAKWSRPLAGVFHLAAVYHESALENETPAGLARIMRPKVAGAWVLNEIARTRPGCLFVNFSSVISFFGTMATGGYAAANTFLDAFSHHQRQACGVQSHNILWSSWTDTGLSRGSEAGEALRSRGFLPIAGEQGVESLLFALRGGHPQLLIGIDGTNRGLQKHISADASAPAAAPALAANFVAPRTEVEKQVAKIWQGILGVPQVGMTDNFFELGGRSLLAAKMFAQIHKTLGKHLPVPALFKSPTLEQLLLIFAEQPVSPAVKIDALRRSGMRPPLFLVPAPGSDGAAFKELSDQLDSDQPCIALQARTLMASGSSAPVEIEAVAKLFAAEIALLAPTGPCLIGGRSLGAALAWATAQQLAAGGRTVALVVLLAPPPAAFFQRDSSGAVPRYRLVKAGGSSGMLGRLFKKSSVDDAGVTKAHRQERDRYGDALLSASVAPVAVFGEVTSTEPWRDLSPAGFAVHPAAQLAAQLRGVKAS